MRAQHFFFKMPPTKEKFVATGQKVNFFWCVCGLQIDWKLKFEIDRIGLFNEAANNGKSIFNFIVNQSVT